MAGCGSAGCSCVFEVGAGLSLSGNGSDREPYRIELTGGLGESLTVNDTQTVNLTLFGGGTPTDPYVLQADATMRVVDLQDVSDAEGPAVGDTLVWSLSGGVGHFELAPPPPSPPGAVNVGAGIRGDGSVGAPIRAAVIGTTAGGANTGLEVYIDVDGNLRAVPPAATAVSWNSITGKPASFPTTPGDFTGTLPVSKGGTGQTSLANVSVGNATKVDNHRIFVQSGTPSGAVLNDLWFW